MLLLSNHVFNEDEPCLRVVLGMNDLFAISIRNEQNPYPGRLFHNLVPPADEKRCGAGALVNLRAFVMPDARCEAAATIDYPIRPVCQSRATMDLSFGTGTAL
jgi:hypothetical protein